MRNPSIDAEWDRANTLARWIAFGGWVVWIVGTAFLLWITIGDNSSGWLVRVIGPIVLVVIGVLLTRMIFRRPPWRHEPPPD